MAASFAGSRVLDERRRRRLAQEQDDLTVAAPNFQSGLGIRIDQPQLTEEAENQGVPLPQLFPVGKLIPQRSWKVWAFCLAVACVTAALFGCRYLVAGNGDSPLMPGPALIARAVGNASLFWKVALLASCGQLSVLIWWARSRSLKDFAGTYRVWSWVSLSWFAAALFVGVDGPVLLSRLAETLLGLHVWRKSMLCWLLPVGCWTMVLWSVLFQELKSCWSSSALLWLGAWAWVIAGGWMLLSELPGDQLVQSILLEVGMVCLFGALTHHARHVIHVSPEPLERKRKPKAKKPVPAAEGADVVSAAPVPRPNSRTIAAVAKKKATRTKRTRTTTPTAEVETADSSLAEADSDGDSTNDVTEQPVPKPASKRRASSRRKSKAEATTIEPAEAETPTSPSESAAQPNTVSEPELERSGNADGPDPELLKGLSKRERRKVRQEWRAQQKAMQQQ